MSQPPSIPPAAQIPLPPATSTGPSALAIVALVLGLVSLVIWPLAVIAVPVCFIALFLTKGRGRGMAIGGFVAALAGAVICAAVVVLVIAAKRGFDRIGDMTQNIIAREEHFTRVGYERLGEEIAERHDGKTLVILYTDFDDGSDADPEFPSQTRSILEALAAGVDGRMTITSVNLAEPGSGAEDAEDDEMLQDQILDFYISAAQFEAALAQHVPGYVSSADATPSSPGDPTQTVVLSLVGLPLEHDNLALWTQDAAARPALALANANLYGLKDRIASGHIDVVLGYNPDATFDPSADIPEDDMAAFDERWILITPETVAAIAAQHPDLLGLD